MGDFTRKKRRLRGKRDWQFDDGSAYLTEPAVRREPRRAKQLCAQITDALQLALVGDTDDVIRDLSLISVTQYGDSSRILLTFALPRGSTLADVHVAEERLSLAKGRLRCEVASAIVRKRTPDLVFQVLRTDDNGRLTFL